eukprot:scaffold5936_cov100-Skeletonema_dohrnii-CCMP3373.AAC.1
MTFLSIPETGSSGFKCWSQRQYLSVRLNEAKRELGSLSCNLVFRLPQQVGCGQLVPGKDPIVSLAYRILLRFRMSPHNRNKINAD